MQYAVAIELLDEGKRDLLVSAIPEAVTKLSQSCRMMASSRGMTAFECADPYFYYGKALVEQGDTGTRWRCSGAGHDDVGACQGEFLRVTFYKPCNTGRSAELILAGV